MGWITYFVEGMTTSFEKVHAQAKREAESGAVDRSKLLRTLDAKQRKVLTLFKESREVSAKEIAKLFGFQQRPAAALCQRWVTEGFLVVADPSKKARRYRLKDELEEQIAAQL
jgi:predicted HTH transcriptional regulator